MQRRDLLRTLASSFAALTMALARKQQGVVAARKDATNSSLMSGGMGLYPNEFIDLWGKPTSTYRGHGSYFSRGTHTIEVNLNTDGIIEYFQIDLYVPLAFDSDDLLDILVLYLPDDSAVISQESGRSRANIFCSSEWLYQRLQESGGIDPNETLEPGEPDGAYVIRFEYGKTGVYKVYGGTTWDHFAV